MQFLVNLPFDLNLLPKPVYVVGGAVRDGLLGRVRAELDLDVTIAVGAIEAARRLAQEYRAGFVLLDAERQIARVVFPGVTLDIAQQEGDILQDLARRDYTLNAIAYDIQAGVTIDPFNGTQDLHDRTMRMVSRDNLADDPLRLLRAYRQGAQLDFTIEPNTQRAIRELAPLLTNVAAERVLTELRYLLQTPHSSKWLAAVIADELLAGWLAIPVRVDYGERLAQIDRAIELIKQHYPALDRELHQPLRDTIPISRGAIGKLTVLLASELAIATAQMLRLTFSSTEIQTVTTAITCLPQLLQGEMSPPDRYFWFQAVGNNFSVLIILAIAAGIEIERLKDIIDNYLDPDSQVAHPTPLVNGHDLIQALQIAPSPTIGKLLTEIQLARIAGKIITPDEALEFAKNSIDSPIPHGLN
jgi:tRNA nucleotidyltransferase (CCA-adding enzyme)